MRQQSISAAIRRRCGELFGSPPARLACRLGCSAGDLGFGLLIVSVAAMGWAPRVGLAAAREAVAARQARRRHVEASRRTGGEVWARHARRRTIAGCYGFSIGGVVGRRLPPTEG